jgi:glycosyltransferase involved in cell wall biosynthesis
MTSNRFRILMLSRFFPPEYSGAALQAMSLARQLRKHGHHVEFVAQRWPGLSPEAVVEGFPVTRLEAGRGEKHREFRYWWNLLKFLVHRRGDFDFLHSHGAYYTDAIVGLLGPVFGMKTLAKASLANNDLHSIGKSLHGRLHGFMLRRIDACIAISRDLEAEFLDAGVGRKKTLFLPNGVDTERFRPSRPEEKKALRTKTGLPIDQPVALYVGVFDARKNIEWLIKQWHQNDAFCTNALLVAVGPQSRDDPDGSLKRSIEVLAEGSPDRLRVVGHTDDIADYYRAADIFFLPSHREGLPNALLEAMACGLPAVAADASGTRELVQEGETGFLFAIDDLVSLEQAVTKALSPASAGLGAAARNLVERQYSVSQLAVRYEELYTQLLGPSD